MVESTVKPKSVGARIKPVEHRKLVTGYGNYIDDIQLPRMAHAAFLRSPYAHAYIKEIDTSKAKNLPGVLAVRTGQELNSRVRPLRIGDGLPGVKPLEVTPLAVDKVRMVGDAVAVVVATDRYVAEDALELIEVQYEPLPVEVDPEKAARGEGVPIHDHLNDNIISYEEGNAGDIDEAYRKADRIIKETFRHQRCTHVPMECRGMIAHWNPGARNLTVWGSLQWTYPQRNLLADIFHLPENKVRVIVPDVGGAFGQKGQIYPGDLAVCLMSIELGVPVKWIEDRRENLTACSQAREHIVEIEAAVKNDGTILGLRARVIDDIGAYALYPWVPNSWVGIIIAYLPNHYKIPNYKWEAICVLTNKPPEAPYRGPGHAIGSWAREGLIDIIARELGLDPLEVRLKNIVREEDQPYHSSNGWILENVSPLETLEQALQAIGYRDFRAEQQRARKANRYLGIGIGSFTNENGANERDIPINLGLKNAGQEVATVRMQPTGRVQAFVSVAPHGQGLETSLSQVLADELGVPMETIEVLHGDSDMPADGAGTFADRSAILGGGAVILAGRELRKKMLKIASHLLEIPEDDLEIQDGYALSRSTPEKRLAVFDIAQAAFSDPGAFPAGLEGGLVSTRRYEYPTRRATSNGAHVAIVEVDVETGKVDIKRYVAVEDCGRVINPMIVEGQIRGCVAQGLGGVLLEHMVYDQSGQPLTATFLDYLLPEATDVPDIEVHLFDNPSPFTLGGFKSAGEGGICGSVAAIINAVADALAPFNIRINRLPLKPDRILQMIGKIPQAS